jgi:soluble lytic murein transglycosylase-like protein
MDSSLRDTTMNSIARWKRRLEGTSSPSELALIGREAEQLRGLALSRGEAALADQLARLAALTGAPAAVVSDAVRGIAELVGGHSPAPPPAPARPFGGTRLVGAPGEAMAAPPPVQRGSSAPPVQRGSSMAPPPVERGSVAPPPLVGGAGGTPGAGPALSMAAPPPLMMSRIGGAAMAPPSMIVDPAQMPAQARSPSGPSEGEIRAPAKQPSRPPGLAGTMLSGGTPGGEEAKRVVPPVRPAAGAPPVQPPRQMPAQPMQAPPQVPPTNANALPPSIAPAVRPPKLLEGTFLGFRAFRGQNRGGASPSLPAGDPEKGILGFQRLTPLDVNAPRVRAPSYPPVDRPRRRLSSRPSQPQTRVDVPRWFYVVLAAIGTLAAVIVMVIVVSTMRDRDGKTAGNKSGGVATGPSSGSQGFDLGPVGGPARNGNPNPTGTSTTTLPPAGFGLETPQMKELLEAQRRLAMTCQKDPATCDRWTLQAIEVAKKPAPAMPVAPPPADEPLAGWLKPFKMPDQFPVRDEAALRSMFDFNTKNIAGRSGFQNKLFACSAYQDIFESTLLKYGAPHWLTAVVFQESACNRLATSQVGAKGLWQFMPESARAYGLRVVEGEIDERLNPIKSTDAAIHFLTDLERELGAWDLALAAYNMGPFGVLARISQVGGHPGFWELAHAGLLPDETTGYVPAIEAYAIALENLHTLKFAPYGASPESTGEVIVKPGTRLSLIALAASTSTVHIHELNPEFLRDDVPEGETTARVPDTAAHRAQAVIDSWSPGDRRDTCAPPEFDWGKQQFETSRYAKNCAQGGPGNGPP